MESLSARLTRFFPLLLLLFCAAITWRPMEGVEDFWAHAAVGRFIWENHAVPRETLWLWSVAPQPWIAHGWLPELLFYGCMQCGGPGTALFVTILFVALPAYWLWKLWVRRGGSQVLGIFLFAYSLFCAAARFQPRPELFTYFFLTVLCLYLINRGEAVNDLSARKSGLAFVGMAALFLLWANCHGGVALGLALLALTIIGDGLQDKLSGKGLKNVTPTVLLLGLAVLVININPYGLAYWKVLRPVGGAMFKMIDEWKPPLADPALPLLVVFVLVPVVVALCAWARNPQRRWAQLLWLLFFTGLFFMARRNLWPVIFMSLTVAAANAGSLGTWKLVKAELTPGAVLVTRIAALLVIGFWTFSSLSPEALHSASGGVGLNAVSSHTPVGVADYILQKSPPDRIFNDYLRSSYLHWRLAGKRKLYIDLHNVYPPQLLADYFEIIGRTPRGKKLFGNLKINTVAFGRWSPGGRMEPLAKYLDSPGSGWKRVYTGDGGQAGVVWVRLKQQ